MEPVSFPLEVRSDGNLSWALLMLWTGSTYNCLGSWLNRSLTQWVVRPVFGLVGLSVEHHVWPWWTEGQRKRFTPSSGLHQGCWGREGWLSNLNWNILLPLAARRLSWVFFPTQHIPIYCNLACPWTLWNKLMPYFVPRSTVLTQVCFCLSQGSLS